LEKGEGSARWKEGRIEIGRRAGTKKGYPLPVCQGHRPKSSFGGVNKRKKEKKGGVGTPTTG